MSSNYLLDCLDYIVYLFVMQNLIRSVQRNLLVCDTELDAVSPEKFVQEYVDNPFLIDGR